MRPVRCREIGTHPLGATSATADLLYDGIGLGRTTAIMNQHLGARLGKGECTRTPHAAGGAGDEGGFS